MGMGRCNQLYSLGAYSLGKTNKMSCSSRDIKAQMRGAVQAQGFSVENAREDTEPLLAVLAGLPSHQLWVGSTQMPGVLRRILGRGGFATTQSLCSAFSPPQSPCTGYREGPGHVGPIPPQLNTVGLQGQQQ